MFHTEETRSSTVITGISSRNGRGGEKKRGGNFRVQLILTRTEGKYLTTSTVLHYQLKANFGSYPQKNQDSKYD